MERKSKDQKRDFKNLTFPTPKCIMLIDVQGRVREKNSLHKEKKLLGTVEMYLCNFKVELFNKTSK